MALEDMHAPRNKKNYSSFYIKLWIRRKGDFLRFLFRIWCLLTQAHLVPFFSFASCQLLYDDANN